MRGWIEDELFVARINEALILFDVFPGEAFLLQTVEEVAGARMLDRFERLAISWALRIMAMRCMSRKELCLPAQ